ncbi:hypothetical protein [[Limnothrix rosea] IAM M-220]|uniref:hypothetical protein n=1 Tax=[Limnothrix rosea] IAM M-220 TaxID=454133 RepID=UPI000959EDAF|nr:hypothetical protein [[Limnothrix rosea] IAM M-220]OKH12923.1 hypothetical protein NIES208_15640 [[Limnothrix rosea] IAM M-220]
MSKVICRFSLLVGLTLSLSLGACVREKTVYVDSSNTTSEDTFETSLAEIRKGQTYQSDEVAFRVVDFKSFGKKMMDFDEEKLAIHEWVGVFVEVSNVKNQPVRAGDLFQSVSLKELTGEEYSSDLFLGIECLDVDLDAIIQPQGKVTFCSVFDAPNKPKELYWETYSSDFSTELRLLMH